MKVISLVTLEGYFLCSVYHASHSKYTQCDPYVLGLIFF